MKTTIISHGKWKRAPEQTLFDHYANRSRWSLELRELGGYPKLDANARRLKETTDALALAKQLGAEKIIMLDETGKTLSSQKLADHHQNWAECGVRHVCWIIGGDVGLDKTQLCEADNVVSFGAMTWPHLLTRALLAEQIYRIQTIISGHPYHRSN